jgi:hypothetical protein
MQALMNGEHVRPDIDNTLKMHLDNIHALTLTPKSPSLPIGSTEASERLLIQSKTKDVAKSAQAVITEAMETIARYTSGKFYL